ncbi:MAG: glycosyltransferase family 9 protein [Ectothiorhodospiraceae bacterium]
MTLHHPVGSQSSELLAGPPEQLCLFRLSAIGDCCHMVPVIRTLQAAWPQTRLTWILGRTEAALLGDLDGVECITFDKRSGLSGYRALRRRLASRRFDALLLMQVALRAGLAATAVRAPVRLGFDRARSRDGHGLFINRRVAAHPRAHVMDGFFDFAAALGVTGRELRWDIPVPTAARERAAALIPGDRPALVISPCSSQRFNNFRNWPPERYAALARSAVTEYGMQVVLTGGPSDEERQYADAISRDAGVPVTDCVGATGLKELLAVVQRATVLVAPDSGPVHMAVAAGTPVIGLYATSNPERTGPYLGREWLVNRYPEAVQAELGKPVDDVAWGRRVRRPDAMERITVADVLARLDALLATPEDQRMQPPGEGATAWQA